jgi:hypothetical protein
MKLNGATIADNVVQRVTRIRGREHCFAELDPARTALVVIDLQNAFMDDQVDHAVVPAAGANGTKQSDTAPTPILSAAKIGSWKMPNPQSLMLPGSGSQRRKPSSQPTRCTRVIE